MNMDDALREAGRKDGRDRYAITAKEQAHIIEMLRVNPLPMVKRDTGRSYKTLCGIAEVAL